MEEVIPDLISFILLVINIKFLMISALGAFFPEGIVWKSLEGSSARIEDAHVSRLMLSFTLLSLIVFLCSLSDFYISSMYFQQSYQKNNDNLTVDGASLHI